MANKARSKKSESVQGYFRNIFKENPKLLKQRSNDALYERWLKDHPDEKEVPERVKQGLSNLKSVLRHRRKTRRRLRQEAMPDGAANGAGAGPISSSAGHSKGLMRLESQIDEALAWARRLDRDGLDDVIRLLRSARNRVIVRIGEV